MLCDAEDIMPDRTEEWARARIEDYVGQSIDSMLRRVELWTDNFTIVLEHKNELWIEKIELKYNGVFVLKKIRARKWSFLDDIVGIFTKAAPESMDYKGQAYRKIIDLEQKHSVDDPEVKGVYRRFSETWMRDALAKRQLNHRIQSAEEMRAFHFVTPPAKF